MFEDTNQTELEQNNQELTEAFTAGFSKEEDLTAEEATMLSEEGEGYLPEVMAEDDFALDLVEEQGAEEKAADTHAADREEFVSLTYIGKEIPLPKEAVAQTAQALGMAEQDVIATIQKGMNYDHLQQKLEKNPEREILDWYAKQNDMSREEYVKALLEQRENLALQQEQEKLATLHPQADSDLLLQLAQANLEKKQQAQEKARQEKQKPWIDFFRAYPQMEVTKIPKEVYYAVNKGEHPVTAMLRYENYALQQQMAMAKQKGLARNKQIGSVKNEAAVLDGEEAGFLAGFWE